MVTGYNICPICNKKYSPYNQSFLHVDTGRITEVTKNKIYNPVCSNCCNKIIKIVNLDEIKTRINKE